MSDEELISKIDALTAAILMGKAADLGNQAQDQGLSGSAQDAIVRQVLSSIRQPSKASLIGDGSAANRPAPQGDAHAWLKASLGGPQGQYVPGSLITSLANARSSDVAEQIAGKASLEALGLKFAEPPAKATLGETGAHGGYVLPNNLVDAVAKPATAQIDMEALLTVRTGVNVRGVDGPYRLGPPARMTAQNWGATKENVDEAYGSYTASLTTFARIYDVGKQYLRFSAGAAEQDVMDELARAARLTVEFETLAGAAGGTGSVGDACNGIITALLATPTWLGYRGAKSGAASASTIAGSFTSALAELLKLLAARSRFPNAVLMDATTYFAVLSPGADTAGFWTSPTIGGGLMLGPDGGMTYLGVPLKFSPQYDTLSGTTKSILGIDGKAFKLYKGAEFRIDSSDTAGTRWDQNLVGFRGEMELGFNADTGIHVGAAQFMTAAIP